jgi:hypothetical protein
MLFFFFQIFPFQYLNLGEKQNLVTRFLRDFNLVHGFLILTIRFLGFILVSIGPFVNLCSIN